MLKKRRKIISKNSKKKIGYLKRKTLSGRRGVAPLGGLFRGSGLIAQMETILMMLIDPIIKRCWQLGMTLGLSSCLDIHVL